MRRVAWVGALRRFFWRCQGTRDEVQKQMAQTHQHGFLLPYETGCVWHKGIRRCSQNLDYRGIKRVAGRICYVPLQRGQLDAPIPSQWHITNSKSTASSTKFGNRPTRSGNTKISHSNHHHMVVRGGNRTEKTI